jgi:ATP-dependent helicase HrpB
VRLVVMSATIDAGPISDYLGNAAVIECPGRQYPIDIQYTSAPRTAPVWDLAAGAVQSLIAAGTQGDVLVFMPGAYEIRRTIQSLDGARLGEPIAALPLYGDLPAARQRQAMEGAARRKIIAATNIAETSLTIPGVRHVVDGGLARVNRYDPGRGFNTLFVEPISMDSADQRAGRAGREAPGTCIRLWSRAQHAGRGRRTTPEVKRVDLAETILYLHMLGYDAVAQFPWFEEPAKAALQAGQELLSLLGAMDSNGAITDLGRQMCAFPMHPRLARMILEAGKRGAVRLAAFSAALLSERSALCGKPEYPEAAYRREIASDFYGQYCLLEKVRLSGFDPMLCARFAVNPSAARSVLRTQALFLHYCRRSGMRTHDAGDAECASALGRCLLAAYPDHFAVRKDQGTLLCELRGNRRAELAKESMARKAKLLIAADIREIKTPKAQVKTILSLATEIKEEWLREDYTRFWAEQSRLEWDPIGQAVESRIYTLCLGVVVSEKTGELHDKEKASAMLADAIVSKELQLFGWEAASEWMNRVRWTAGLFPEQKLPVFTDDDRRLALLALCDQEYRYERVKNKPLLPFLQALLSDKQRRFVDETAPQVLLLPSGKKMRILYEPTSPPRGRARIQDLFGLRATPRVAAGKAPVVIEVLAPNNRPVQITDDLENFWQTHYPAIKKALSRRYPKHEWR